jgi:hypothetical protein
VSKIASLAEENTPALPLALATIFAQLTGSIPQTSRAIVLAPVFRAGSRIDFSDKNLSTACHPDRPAANSNRRRTLLTTAGRIIPGTVILVFVTSLNTLAAADQPLALAERLGPGYQYHVSVRVDLTGTLTPPPQPGKSATPALPFAGDSAIEYDERILTVDKDGIVQKTARLCRRTDFRRTIAGQTQQSGLRPAVRRLIVLRRDNAEVPFSPDGALTRGEIDLIRTDVFTPALTGLLPNRLVQPGDRWTATQAAVRELTALERIDAGTVDCRLEQVTTDGRRVARVTLSGTVRGVNEDGPNRQTLEGYFSFDLESNHLSYLYLKGVHVLLDKDGRDVGRVEGRFVMNRQANTSCPELGDDGLRGAALEPDADNTLLLYDNAALGVRFLYPRRWRVGAVRGTQVTLDGADGNGLVLTLDPADRPPDGKQFLEESRTWLLQQRGRILREERLRLVRGDPVLETFATEAELNGQRFLMDYYVTRQQAGGATLAARLVPADLEVARREVDKLARSIVISKPGGPR